ncbi:MAG: hypothetical protein K6G37_00110 [Bacilli bacterium]|nr:hypothetical protein [Bacilli bacterium]
MKEATGELNSTVIVVITIGLLSTFFFTVIWPLLKNNLNSNTKCSEAICSNEAKKSCVKDPKTRVCKYVECTYNKQKVKCPYKG